MTQEEINKIKSIKQFLRHKKAKTIKCLNKMVASDKLGNIYVLFGQSTSPRKRSPYTTNNGYLAITFKINGKQSHYLVHRLVAAAFKNGFCLKNKKVVHHINGKKQDNRLCNLQVLNHSHHNRKNRKKAIENKNRFIKNILKHI